MDKPYQIRQKRAKMNQPLILPAWSSGGFTTGNQIVDQARMPADKNQLSLQESEIRYRRLFEAAQDGILILDANTGLITDANPYLTKMLGYSREELVTRKLWEVGAFKDV